MTLLTPPGVLKRTGAGNLQGRVGGLDLERREKGKKTGLM